MLERLLDAGHVGSGGGFLGGMTNEKYAKITGTSKATATRDLTDLLAHDLLRVEGMGKATRYAVNVPGTTSHPVCRAEWFTVNAGHSQREPGSHEPVCS